MLKRYFPEYRVEKACVPFLLDHDTARGLAGQSHCVHVTRNFVRAMALMRENVCALARRQGMDPDLATGESTNISFPGDERNVDDKVESVKNSPGLAEQKNVRRRESLMQKHSPRRSKREERVEEALQLTKQVGAVVANWVGNTVGSTANLSWGLFKNSDSILKTRSSQQTDRSSTPGRSRSAKTKTSGGSGTTPPVVTVLALILETPELGCVYPPKGSWNDNDEEAATGDWEVLDEGTVGL